MNPLIDALMLKLKVQIRFLTQVVHIGIEVESFQVPLILAFSQHSLLFLDTNLQKLAGEVFYVHIEKVVEDLDCSEDVIKFEFSNHRAKGMPKKMTLILADKERLIKYLRCGWETDYMWRFGKVQALGIVKEKLDISRYTKKSNDLKVYLEPSSESNRFEYKNYSFFVDTLFEEKSPGWYTAVYEKIDYELDVEFLEVFPIGKEVDIQYLAEKKLGVEGEYEFIVNHPYVKKSNLAADLAVWEGWEIGVISLRYHLYYIVFKRKFIPPLADYSQIVVVTCKGGRYSRYFCENTADSIYSLGLPDKSYTNILQQKCDALIMDEDLMSYYQQKFEIYPESSYFAYQILLTVLKVVDKYIPGYKKIISSLEKKPLAKKLEFSVKDEPNEILDIFFSSSYLSSLGAGYKYWKKKVMRYVVYALNGGMTEGKVDLKDLLTSISKLKSDLPDCQSLKILMNRLLHMRQSLDQDELEDIQEIIRKVLETSKYNLGKDLFKPANWKFNEIMMANFIETGYLKKELGQSSSLEYLKFLAYLLQSKSTTLKLKSSVCRSCLDLFDSLLDSKVLIPALMEVYTSKSLSLSGDASEAVLKLIKNDKEHKKELFKYLQVFIQKLNSKDHKVIGNTLLVLISLSSDYNRKKKIFKAALSPLKNLILVPNGFPKFYPTISKCFQLLCILIKDAPLEIQLIDEALVSASINYLTKSHESAVIDFLQSLSDKSFKFRKMVGKLGISKLTDYLKSVKIIQTAKQAVKLLKTLSINKLDDNFKIFKAKQTEKVLENLLQSEYFNQDAYLIQQIKSLLEYLNLNSA